MIVIVIVIFQEGTQLAMAVFSGALKKKKLIPFMPCLQEK